jgi:hypothetical protein
MILVAIYNANIQTKSIVEEACGNDKKSADVVFSLSFLGWGETESTWYVDH